MMKPKIQEDLRAAVKKNEKLNVSVLRLLLAALLNKEKEKRYKIIKAEPELAEEDLQTKAKLTDEEIIDVISSEIKKRKEAILGFEKAKREDSVEKEKKEMEILKEYMPEQLSEQELQKLAEEAVKKVGAASLKDMGKVMAELMPKVKRRADGSQMSQIVRDLISQ